MKKSRILAAAMASIVMTGALAACGKQQEEEFKSENNSNVCVYGPPPVFSEDAGDTSSDGQELFETSSAEDNTSSDASQGE